MLLPKLVVALLAHRHFAGGQTDPVEGRLGEAKPLVHVGHDFDHLVDEIAICVLDDFGDKTRSFA